MLEEKVGKRTSALLEEIRERRQAEEALRHLNEELENRVAECTAQLEAANRAKSDFLANMSHELRTPLNSVIGFSDVLLDEMFGPLNEKQGVYVNNIIASGRHLLDLINDILDLSKVEAGKMELELDSLPLRQLLEGAISMLVEKALKQGVTISLQLLPDADVEIDADERKLKQIMFNLLSNAVKFTPEGGTVRVGAGVAAGDFIEISVEDTGIGIRDVDMEKLFTEFTQIESPYVKSQEGTGLGLALTRRLVELHGGRIWVESVYGRGSRFTFMIPMLNSKLKGVNFNERETADCG